MIEHQQLAFTWAMELPSSAAPDRQELEEIAALSRELGALRRPTSSPRRDAVHIDDPPPAAIERENFAGAPGPIPSIPAEVREFTEGFADLLINLIEAFRQVDQWLGEPQCSDCARLYHERDAILLKYRHLLRKYGRDFGPQAADRLHTYACENARASTHHIEKHPSHNG